MSWTEGLGFATGAVSVWLFVRQNVWAWPTGIANSAFWLVLFWGSRLYLDAGLQIVYIGLGVWGWYWWLRGGRRGGADRDGADRDGADRDAGGGGRLPVSRTPRGEAWLLAGIGVAGTLGLWWAMVAVGDALPLPDAATTVVSLIAQYMLTRKLLANWWCWIAVDVAYVVMYASQHLYLTAGLQPLFIAMCVMGLRQWRADLRARDIRPARGAPGPARAANPAVAP
jgi:nicotinamide mononucleotide transporter